MKTMTKICYHTSVGMFVYKGDKLLLIERMKFPFGFAVPAGHVDEDKDFESAAMRELKEEVGLDGMALEKIYEGRRGNPCRREGGDWHFWKLYRIEVTGDLKRSPEETKKAGWYSVDEIKALAQKTERYMIGIIPHEEWERSPGLEPVMLQLFKAVKII
jgi:ADP-ribose pyrophosphatase YjhB (NUDIX family)